MLIYLIRHADTVHGRDDVFRGRTDVPLSELGKAQAAACARAIAGKRLKAVYSGPLSRARDTAAAIAAPHGLTPVIEPAFDDIHIGDWEGLSSAKSLINGPDSGRSGERRPTLSCSPGASASTTLVSVHGRRYAPPQPRQPATPSPSSPTGPLRSCFCWRQWELPRPVSGVSLRIHAP